jgi:O-acetyl-ADP-ribose deacetylase (regulator of RNase III)
VIHAVGPVWQGGLAGEQNLLASAYRRSLEVAEELGCRTIAFPALSTGIYGYPAELAAPVAVSAAEELANHFDEIRFVFLDESLRRLYEHQLGDSEGGQASPAS